MIDPKILNVLESELDDPSYSVIIQKFQQPKFCNREELQMIVNQINPNLFDIIEKKDTIIQTLKQLLTSNNIPIPDQNDLSINNIVQKTLTIDSTLNYDQVTDMFTSGLIGNISNESNQNIPTQSVGGEIKNKRMIFTSKDYPNILNNKQFIVEKNRLIINVDDNIQNIKVTLTHENLTALYKTYSKLITFTPYETNIVTDGQVIINIDDIRNHITPTQDIQTFDDNIALKNDAIDALEDLLIEEDPEEEIDVDDINAQITALEEERDTLINQKQAILNKIQSLNFSSTKPFNINIEYTFIDDVTSKPIECINFELSSKIDIDFFNKYITLPGIVLTIDKKNKKYTSYDTIFKTNELGQYTGVTIIFNNLKRIREPIEVNAIIIGDEIVKTNNS